MPEPCPVCRHRGAALLAEGEDFEYRSLPGPFRMWRCEDCGHAFLDPLPRPDQLGTIYPPTYYTVNPRSPLFFEGRVYDTKLRRDVERIVRLAGDPRPRSVVDLGCGDAERLARVGEHLAQGGERPELVGVDLRPDESRRAGLAERGVRLVQADLEQGLGALEDGAHDLVIMCQIIEHLRDPTSALESVAKKLAPGGRLLVETPNLGGLDYHLMKHRYWGGYHFPRHFHIFTRATLERAVAAAGLRAVRRGFMPSGFGIVGLRNALGLTSIERSRRFGEFLHFRNLLVVGSAVAADTVCMLLGGATSNQYLVAERGTA